jgi:hypothetical protein
MKKYRKTVMRDITKYRKTVMRDMKKNTQNGDERHQILKRLSKNRILTQGLSTDIPELLVIQQGRSF